jgi:RimJ/RimL family protein N-acetyltransferase
MALRHQGEPPGIDGALMVQPSAAAPGLLLRPWTERDVPAMVAAHRDPVMRHWLRHPVTTAEDAHQVIQARRADRRAGTGFSFAVLEAHADGATGDLVGGVSIRGLAREAASGEVGYWVTAPSRGRGIAPRALSAVCEWAFRLPRTRPLEQLELIHAVGNHASCRVADKTGFALSAVLPPLPPELPNDAHLHIRPAGKPPVTTQTLLSWPASDWRLPYQVDGNRADGDVGGDELTIRPIFGPVLRLSMECGGSTVCQLGMAAMVLSSSLIHDEPGRAGWRVPEVVDRQYPICFRLDIAASTKG